MEITRVTYVAVNVICYGYVASPPINLDILLSIGKN